VSDLKCACIYLFFTWNHTCTGVTGMMTENCQVSVGRVSDGRPCSVESSRWRTLHVSGGRQPNGHRHWAHSVPSRPRPCVNTLFIYLYRLISAEVKVKCDCGRIHCPVAESQIIISWKNITNTLNLQENKKIEKERQTERNKEWKKESIGLQVLQSCSLLF